MSPFVSLEGEVQQHTTGEHLHIHPQYYDIKMHHNAPKMAILYTILCNQTVNGALNMIVLTVTDTVALHCFQQQSTHRKHSVSFPPAVM